MIDIKQNPKAIHDLETGDLVKVDNVELVVTVYRNDVSDADPMNGQIYFTSTASKGLSQPPKLFEEVSYHEYFQHLRRSDVSNKAMMAREEVIEIIQNGGYYVG